MLALHSRKAVVLDLGMAAFALTSFVVPIVARRATANDIELRVMSPMLIPVIYVGRASRSTGLCTRRVVALAGTALLGWWMYQGVAFAVRFPDLAPGGAGYRPQFAPQLYDAIDALPDRRQDPDEQPAAGVVVHRSGTDLDGFHAAAPG